MLELLQPGTIRCRESTERLKSLTMHWATAGQTLLHQLSDRFAPWIHYGMEPGAGGSRAGSCHFFYHRHEPAEDGEHGHFHLFMNRASVPPGLSPLLLPDRFLPEREASRRNPTDAAGSLPNSHVAGLDLCHLLGIGLDAFGLPVRVFTTNRWVTGETWYAAPDVLTMLKYVNFGGDGAVERWLYAVLRAFRPEIEGVLRDRDAAIARLRLRRPTTSPYEDRRLAELSSCPIRLDIGRPEPS